MVALFQFLRYSRTALCPSSKRCYQHLEKYFYNEGSLNFWFQCQNIFTLTNWRYGGINTLYNIEDLPSVITMTFVFVYYSQYLGNWCKSFQEGRVERIKNVRRRTTTNISHSCSASWCTDPQWFFFNDLFTLQDFAQLQSKK